MNLMKLVTSWIKQKQIKQRHYAFYLYAHQNDDSIRSGLGATDYSYYFVLKSYIPLLQEIGSVNIVKDPMNELPALVAENPSEQPLFLCFTPPHDCIVVDCCPTICVFAWEYGSLPNESFGDNPKDDWTAVLASIDGAITHSSYAAQQFTDTKAENTPVTSIPAPIWDDYCTLKKRYFISSLNEGFDLTADICLDVSYDASDEIVVTEYNDSAVRFSGVIYTAVTNLNDGRKNWEDTVSAFCYSHRSNSDATLILKSTYYDYDFCKINLCDMLRKVQSFKCRVVLLHGYLDNDSYSRLLAHTHFAVNSSRGEGQCLPLMEYMSAGKPALAPRHSAMLDYINQDNTFIVASDDEWSNWPHDPRLFLRTSRARINWQSLHDAYTDSYQTVKYNAPRYNIMAQAAQIALRQYCSLAIAKQELTNYLLSNNFYGADQT